MGFDPAEVVAKYQDGSSLPRIGRRQKDGTIGRGVIDWPKLFRAAKKAASTITSSRWWTMVASYPFLKALKCSCVQPVGKSGR
jgi:hypothetical protein